MSKVVLDAEPNGLRVITLNDPERRNAIGRDIRRQLTSAVAAVRSDEAAKCLIVAGAGTAFCAGGDLPELLGGPGQSPRALRRGLTQTYASFLAIRDLEIPTIAAVHGAAVGAGLNLALSCDIRVLGPKGYLAANFSRLGIHPGGGATHFLVSALGSSRAFELLLRGATIDSSQAAAFGLATSTCADPMASARELADIVCDLDGRLVRDIKATLRVASSGSFDEALVVEGAAQARSISRAPHILERRPSKAAVGGEGGRA